MKPSMALTMLAAFARAVLAYDDNCDGSFFPAVSEDCVNAGAYLLDRGSDALYYDDFNFSYGGCRFVYKTNGDPEAATNPATGKDLERTAYNIAYDCGGGGEYGYHGSYGTGNCEGCHLTIDYRNPYWEDGR